MILRIEDDFDLRKIADSGQCFRFNYKDGGYIVQAVDKFLFIKENGDNSYDLSCSEDEFERFWKSYFDLDTDYRAIRKRIDKKTDPYLYAASEFGKGIRILRQDAWEMLISFIISQRKNIPAIKASIEKLCALAGHVIYEDEHFGKAYSFPTPEELSKLSLDELGSCSLGYRDKYVQSAARAVVCGEVDLEAFKALDDEALRDELLKLFGVGVKVANCEILFGYHRLDAFPKDVWINRVLESRYKDGFMFEKYAPFNGVCQQYLFFYSRSNGI